MCIRDRLGNELRRRHDAMGHGVAQTRLVREAGGELVEHPEQLDTMTIVQVTDLFRHDPNTRQHILINNRTG